MHDLSLPPSRVEPTAQDVITASQRLRGYARITPLLEAAELSERLRATVLIKLETLQIGGAFKYRGACNRLLKLDAGARERGVVAWSSGNHAQGIALAGARLGIATTVVMPADAPQIKLENTRRFGAEVITYERRTQSRELIAGALARERGATLVPSYDDPDVIAGQGTVALEMHAQVSTLCGRPLDVLLVPCGGGGLIAGCALALAGVNPETRLYAVEPEEFDDTCRSLRSGVREEASAGAQTICDALMAPTPGQLTFPIVRRLVTGGVTVTDAMVLAAIRYAWSELKIVVEPGGAVALAAALHGLVDCAGQTVGIVASGANIDAPMFARALK